MIKTMFKLFFKVLFAIGIVAGVLALLRIWDENNNDYIEIYNDGPEGEWYE